ncbi:hypothetical protein AB1Y20_000599 [Prymnesium parvum]|uniref:ShKT domain-containing protein n=1 Tax=Prymnesium parvum TaxID=97485 RepID=A0AB34K8T1_PRYPA
MRWLLLLAALLPPARGSCEDREEECRVWAHTGECRRNWEWMSVHCPAACGVCGVGVCADAEPDCAVWANASECESNPRFMIERCPSSCDACPTLRAAAMECDACLALQETTWRHLAYTHSDEASQHVWAKPEGKQAIRVALRDLCSSHEWLSLGVSLEYHRWCEATVSQHLELMASSWASELSSSHGALLDRATALRQKTTICVASPPEGIGACTDRELHLLRVGIPTPPGGCAACRTFVADAVTIFRRSAKTPREMDSAEFRRAARLIDDLCDDLDMRHFPPHGTAASVLYEDCSHLVRSSYDILLKLVHQWTYTDIEHYVCSRMLALCWEEDQEDGALEPPSAWADSAAKSTEGAASRNHGSRAMKFPNRQFVHRDAAGRDQAAFNAGLERAERLLQQTRQREL